MMQERYVSSTESPCGMSKSAATNLILLTAGLATGALIMFLLDPDAGRRRRKLAADKARRMGKVAGRKFRQNAQYARNMARGRMHEMRDRTMGEGPIPDDLLVERVRAQMGRGVRHTHALHVSARDGVVTLRGPILAEEVDVLLHNVRNCRGVKEIHNELDVHQDAGRMPSLQG